MRRHILTGVVLLVALAFSSIGATAAFAEEKPEILGSAETEAFTGKSGKATLVPKAGAANITCAKSTDKGNLSKGTKKLGTLSLTFEGCGTTIGGECHTEGDASGVILITPAEWHLFYALKPPTDHLGFVILFGLMHFLCKETLIGEFLVLVRTHNGNGIITLIEPAGTASKEFKINTEQKGGVQAETSYWKSAGAAETSEVFLESAVDIGKEVGKFEQSGEEALAGTLTATNNKITLDAL